MAKLRPILGREELTALLESAHGLRDEWIQEEARRKQLYRELSAGADRKRLLGMMVAVIRYKQERIAAGKKCHQCDDNFLRDAEKLLCGEISVVMSMDYSESRNYLYQKLNENTLREM